MLYVIYANMIGSPYERHFQDIRSTAVGNENCVAACVLTSHPMQQLHCTAESVWPLRREAATKKTSTMRAWLPYRSCGKLAVYRRISTCSSVMF